MKIPYCKLSLAFIVQLSALNLAYAQKTATLLPPPKNIIIDGDIKEWGDSLRYYNTEKQINYAIANDKDNLYVAVRIEDRREQNKILKAGLTFSIDPKGKKKETYSITFPLNVAGGTPALNIKNEDNGQITQQERDELAQERITTLRGIKVEGFKDVEGDMITTSNTYGFKTAVNYDDAGYLVCEASIPLSFFHINDVTKEEWAFNIKINGIKRPAPGDGDARQQSQSGGHGGGGKGGSHSSLGEDQTEMFKSTDFWEKYYLAK
jgi:YD repeat-containing protein